MLRHRQGVDVLHKAGNHLNGICVAERTERVPALGVRRDAVPLRTHRTVKHGFTGAIQREKGHGARSPLAHQRTGALQIAKPFLTHIAHEYNALFCARGVLRKPCCQHQKHGKVGGVVPNTGAKHLVALFPHAQGRLFRKHSVHMRGHYHYFAAALARIGKHHIARLIQIGLRAVPAQVRKAKLCAPALAACGRRDGAQLVRKALHLRHVCVAECLQFLFPFHMCRHIGFLLPPAVYPRVPFLICAAYQGSSANSVFSERPAQGLSFSMAGKRRL